MMNEYLYPCTGYINPKGFGAFFEENIGNPRKNINMFAEELKEKYNIPYISLVNSGSSANLVGAMAMAEKIKRAKKPLTAAVSAFTFPTTLSSLIMAGFEIKMVDTVSGGFTMDIEKLKDEVSLIVPTHFLGFPCDMKKISETAKEKGCFVLQDSCETINLLDKNGKQYFSYGDITTWSFYHPHHLSSYGGGAVLCGNIEDYTLTDSIVHWGRSCKCHINPEMCKVPKGAAHQFTYERVGLNVEISELNACFGRWQLRSFDEQEVIRKRNYKILYETLKDVKSITVYPHMNIGGSLFVFPIHMNNGMTVNEAYSILSEQGVEIRTLMGGVSNEQKAFKFISDEKFNNAGEMAEHTFFVGIHQTLTEQQVTNMADILFKTFSISV